MAMKQGTIIDATLIAVPSSTKIKKGKRVPEKHQTKKGDQWYYGMKVHIGVDNDSGLIHSVVISAANVNDLTPEAPPAQAAGCAMQQRVIEGGRAH